jgi:ABC-type enterochelin transport system ATPase subunit
MDREDLKQKVFEMVVNNPKKMKPGDLARTLARLPGVNKTEVKAAITDLISEGRLIYSYAGHSWLEVPPADEE